MNWPSHVALHELDVRFLRNLEPDGREEGGFISLRDDQIGFVSASIADESSRARTKLDLGRAARLLEDPTLQLIGDFHTHPTDCSVEPSGHDVENWQALARSFGATKWLGVITAERTNDRGDWIDTEIGAYAVELDAGGNASYSRIDINEEI